ncbi:hypothetical protein SH601_06665 [Gracilibacillus sp. S3-1-1]|uniref:Uncharacterized protein n=1 Tax=Gracilibacillus pellucidus TaxID=3095368 RepID=A0ACC6M445_9BACI|nr:hypothetical protein [Gracilibacillus sp. S3-1-1]MDX8045668.1 hypothetical protein [Gracilibacillus sp. S3-1-1]
MMRPFDPSQPYMYDQYGNMYPEQGFGVEEEIDYRGFPGGGPSAPPPSGPPVGPPGVGPGQQPGQGQGPGMPPTGPPPAYTPQQSQQLSGPQLYAVDPGSLRGCLYRYTYVWLSRFNSFWFYPTYIGRRSVAGYRWTGFNWVYYGIDLENIQSFTCV